MLHTIIKIWYFRIRFFSAALLLLWYVKILFAFQENISTRVAKFMQRLQTPFSLNRRGSQKGFGWVLLERHELILALLPGNRAQNFVAPNSKTCCRNSRKHVAEIPLNTLWGILKTHRGHSLKIRWGDSWNTPTSVTCCGDPPKHVASTLQTRCPFSPNGLPVASKHASGILRSRCRYPLRPTAGTKHAAGYPQNVLRVSLDLYRR